MVSSAIPHANSTTSMPRTTSPRASSKVLPCSHEMIRASSSVCSTSSSRNLNITRARRVTDMSRQAANAALAGGDGGVDVGRVGERQLALEEPRRRVIDRRRAPGVNKLEHRYQSRLIIACLTRV